MHPEFTPEQLDIINEQGNCVVIAKPGSGKTATLARIIQLRLTTLPSYKGVIAISFTNKASRLLQERALTIGIERNASFFGTIDKFFITEIIIPFGAHVFGSRPSEIAITNLEDLVVETTLRKLSRDKFERDLSGHIEEIASLYRAGTILLESVGFTALYIFSRSRACRRYIQARYSDIIVDEYQDCGAWQHQLFLAVCREGLRGVAVGDLDQSIFKFAFKDPKYLTELAQSPEYHTYPLTFNHRCHPSIVHYATKFISPGFSNASPVEGRVFRKKVDGAEAETGAWLNEAIPHFAKLYGVDHFNRIGILVRNTRTAALVRTGLRLRHKYFLTTPLDEDATPGTNVLRDILIWMFDPTIYRIEFLNDALGSNHTRAHRQRAAELLRDLRLSVYGEMEELQAALIGNLALFHELAGIFLGRTPSERSIERLGSVLSNYEYLQSYLPPEQEEVQLLTIHKAKGQEYEIVFHLDLHEYILPNPYRDVEEDAKLHYVALTRPKLACILVTSTHRHDSKGRVISATTSSFATRKDLMLLSVRSSI